MEIEDEVEIMVAGAIEAINFSDDILSVVRQQLQEFDLRETVLSILDEAGIGTGTTVATQEQHDVQMLAVELGSGSALWGIVDTLEAEILQLRSTVEVLSGAVVITHPENFENLSIADTLMIGGDARAVKDFYVDGTLYAEDIFVPGLIHIDGRVDITGDTDIAGRLTAGSFEINSGATVHGPLNIDGVLVINGQEIDLSGLVSTGSMLNLSSLLVKNSIMILGNITIEGMAEILGDVIIGGDLTVSGALTINNNQAGYAVVVQTGTSALVTFGSGTFTYPPIVTASSDDFASWRIRNVSGTGFTIETKEPATEDITFSWHAMLTEDPHTFKGLPAGASINDVAFFVDPSGVPLSTSDIWNACIRSQQPLGLDGKPFNCRRYHDDDMWTHPDHQMQFMWDTQADIDLRLIIPRGYYIEVVGKEEEEVIVEDVSEPEILEEQERETGTGEVIVDPETDTGTGEVIVDPEPETGKGEVIIDTQSGDTSPHSKEEIEEINEIEEETPNQSPSGSGSVQAGTGEVVIGPEPEPEAEPETGTGELVELE